MKILQANMHRSKTADALLDQLLIEKNVDIVVISEQYGRPKNGTWIEDTSRTAAIWIPTRSTITIEDRGCGTGFVWLKTNELTIFSCYLTPNEEQEAFRAKLHSIEDKGMEIGSPLIIGGDFNSHAYEWGSQSTNSRGRLVLDMTARMGLIIMNRGNVTTFRRPGCRGTIPDITLASESVASKVVNWTVLEDYTGSDHQYIMYGFESSRTSNQTNTTTSSRKWNVAKLDTDALLDRIAQCDEIDGTTPDAGDVVRNTMSLIKEACNEAMPTIGRKHRKEAVYWWTDEISNLRRVCLRCRRKYTRARRTHAATSEAEEFKRAKKDLKGAILRTKKRKWEELRSDLNNDPWGLGYKLVMRKLGARTSAPDLKEDTMENIVNTLFPTSEIVQNEGPPPHGDPPPPFTITELQTAANALKNRKAPGPDGIPAEILKIIAKEKPQLLLEMYNRCLQEGVFPEVWKRQRLVLISKGKGDPDSPSAYRPLCMLDTAGKLLEMLLKPRIHAALENAGGLSTRQHGFRPGRSTIGAIEDVIEGARKAQTGNHFSRRIVLLATLDVRNAFNSATWTDMIEALETRFRAPAYIMRMVRSYLRDRVLIYENAGRTHKKQITAGAAQGSILGPELWNISYDDILHIEMPSDTYLVGYADDIAAVIAARNMEEAQSKLNQVMLRTKLWLDSHSLKLATEKTELLIITRKHIPVEVDMRVLSETIKTRRWIKYLGLRLDPRLTFRDQFEQAATKAAQTTVFLSRLMANIGGPNYSKRKLMMATTQSILLYGCEIWADALQAKYRRKMLAAVQRTAALRVASAYRTVSEPAVLVISATIPIDLLAEERKELWRIRRQIQRTNRETRTREARAQTMQRWQDRWNSESRGRWTARLITDLDKWVNRKHGEINYFVTQMLSGHGYFLQYLHRMGKVDRAVCIYGDNCVDDAEHTFFRCERWRIERQSVEEIAGEISPENIVNLMLENEDTWKYVATFVERVLRDKKRDLDVGATTAVR